MRRRLGWLLVPLLLVPAFAAWRSLNAPRSYRASAVVLVVDTPAQQALNGPARSTSAAARNLDNDLNLAKSDTAHTLVAASLGVTVDALADPTITAEAAADVLRFVATANDPTEAAEAANAWAETFVSLKQAEAAETITAALTGFETRLDQAVTERDQAVADDADTALFDAQIVATTQSITELQLANQLALDGTARVVNAATVPTTPTNAPLARDLVLGVVVGTIIGGAAALLVDNLDRRVRSTADVEALGLPVLAEIPLASKRASADPALATLHQPTSPVTDGYQRARIALDFALFGLDHRMVLVTSAQPSEGKTTTATNLAGAFANAGRDVVLVDADLRRPRIDSVFPCSSPVGLTGAVLGARDVAEIASTVPTADRLIGRLAVVPSGEKPPDPARFLASDGCGTFLGGLRPLADVVVIDAPPTLPVADALALAPRVDGVVLVVRANQTSADHLVDAVAQLESAGGTVVGVVLAGVRVGRSTYYGGEDDHQTVIDLRDESPATQARPPVEAEGAAVHVAHAAANGTPA